MTAAVIVLAVALAGTITALVAAYLSRSTAKDQAASLSGEVDKLRGQLERAAADLHASGDIVASHYRVTTTLEDRAHADIKATLAHPDATRDRNDVVLYIRERAEAARAAARNGTRPNEGPVPALPAAKPPGPARDGGDL